MKAGTGLIILLLALAPNVYADEGGSALETVEKAVTKIIETPVKLVGKTLGFILKPIVVTPWGTDEYSFNVSKNVSVITSDEIENSCAKTLPELLNYRSGVTSSLILGNSKGASVDIRGFGEAAPTNILVLIDGRRTNQIDLSGVDWAGIDISMIERLEIVRGAASVLYGDNAAGGVINIITKKGIEREPTIKLEGALGSFGHHRESATVTGYHDILDYFLSYSHRDEQGYRENNSFKSNNWFGRINFHPGDRFELGTSAGLSRDKYGTPGPLRQAQLEREGRRGTIYPDDWAWTEDAFITGEPKYTYDTEDHTFIATAHSTYRRRETGAIAIATNAWHGQTNHKIHSAYIRPKLEVYSNLFDGGAKNTLAFGTDHFLAKDDITSGNILTGRDDVRITKNSCAIYGHDKLELLERFLFNGGYRYEWVDYNFDQKAQLTNNDEKGLNEWAYEIGGGYKYNPSSQAYINYSRSYRYPATEEYYQSLTSFWGAFFGGLNRDIKQQVGHNLEVGIKDNSLEWLSVDADVFWIDTKREIYFDPSTFTNTNYAPRTSRHGYDVEAKANIAGGRFSPYVGYTYQKAHFHGGVYNNNDIPFVPRHRFAGGLTMSPLKGLVWDTVFNYTGSRYMVSDQNNRAWKVNSHATVDTKLSYKWKGLTIYGSVKNIFNRKHIGYAVTNAGATAVAYYPAPGTVFEVGGSVEF